MGKSKRHDRALGVSSTNKVNCAPNRFPLLDDDWPGQMAPRARARRVRNGDPTLEGTRVTKKVRVFPSSLGGGDQTAGS